MRIELHRLICFISHPETIPSHSIPFHSSPHTHSRRASQMASSTRARSSAIYIHDGDSSPSKSSSNLRSFFASKIHKKEPDASPGDEGLLRSSASTPYLPLPPQHRSRQQHQPGEEQRLQYPLSEREPPNMKSKSSRLEDTRKRNKSVISLKSFINSDKQDRSEARDISPSRDSQQHASHHQASSSRSSPKKSKSSTNLSFLFKRSSQSKENILPPAEPNKENDRRNSPQSYSRQRSGTQEIRESHQTGIRHYPAANPTDPRRRTMGPQELSSLHALYDPLGLSKESPPIQVGTGVSPRSPNRTNAPPLDDVKSNHMSRKSHVAALVDIFNNKGTASTPTTKDLSPQEVETAFESLLVSWCFEPCGLTADAYTDLSCFFRNHETSPTKCGIRYAPLIPISKRNLSKRTR